MHSASVMLYHAFLFPTPGERAGSRGPTAAGKAASCTIISSNSPFEKVQLEFDRFPVAKHLSWISWQWAEDSRCAGRQMFVRKANTKGQITTSCCRFPCCSPWVLQPPREQFAVMLVVTLSPALSQQMIFCTVSIALCKTYSGCSPWRGCADGGNRAGLGYKEKQRCPHPPWSMYFCLSLCSLRSALDGTLAGQLESSPATSAFQGDKERLFNSPYAPANARMDTQPKWLLSFLPPLSPLPFWLG